jgi:hypothetical protein
MSHVREKRLHAGFCFENLNEKDHMENLGVDGKILKRIRRKWD